MTSAVWPGSAGRRAGSSWRSGRPGRVQPPLSGSRPSGRRSTCGPSAIIRAQGASTQAQDSAGKRPNTWVADRKAVDAVAGGDHGAGPRHVAAMRSAVRLKLRHGAGAECVIDAVQAAGVYAHQDLAPTERRRLPVVAVDVVLAAQGMR